MLTLRACVAGKHRIATRAVKAHMNILKIATTIAFLMIGSAALAQAEAENSPAMTTLSSDIRDLLAAEEPVIDGVPILVLEVVRHVYEANSYNPYWTNEANIRELVQLIGKAYDHGLDPADYNIQEVEIILAGRLQDPSSEIRAEADVLLTESLLRYGYQRRYGKLKASSMDPDINFKRAAFRDGSPAQIMREILAAPSLQGFIDLAAPSGPYYSRIQFWLAQYRQLSAAGGWPVIPGGPTLRMGDTDERIAIIRTRLEITGELQPGNTSQSTGFDERLHQAVIDFQTRHALLADGVIGQNTLAEMNVPVDRRINQMRVALERLRWVNQEAANTLVAVNIASFRAFFIRNSEMVWTTRAMVGKSYRRTPVFRGDIQYLEFNPTWTIPPTILKNDTLPAIKRDPNYLASKNIRVIDRNGAPVDPASVDWEQYKSSIPYMLRQDPGPDNALGTVKFIFPNEHLVFLHDTPNRELFNRPERAFSSGCIRIEDPLVLGAFLLADQDYGVADLEAIVAARKTQRIHLKNPMPVIITYLTVGIDLEGNLMFFKDIYNRDQKVLEGLSGPVLIDLPTRPDDPSQVNRAF